MSDLNDPLILNPPIQRAAYSDRTAWLMSLLAQAAYIKFEGQRLHLPELAKALAEGPADENTIRSRIEQFLAEQGKVSGEETERLDRLLGSGNFKRLATVNGEKAGTQGFIAHRESDDMVVLAFRGTEKDLKDIKADLNARFYRRGGAKIHTGFLEAWQEVKDEVIAHLKDSGTGRVYVTGHSLGGALAIVALSELSREADLSDRLAACYTFGSPRVGNDEFGEKVKAPIYRVVHASDIVPRVPPTYVFGFFAWASQFFPSKRVSEWLQEFFLSFHGYVHHGDMRQLTGHESVEKGMKLISNPGTIERALRFVRRVKFRWNTFYEDHSISIYARKLGDYAAYRQK